MFDSALRGADSGLLEQTYPVLTQRFPCTRV
jgi:hypothetical protein